MRQLDIKENSSILNNDVTDDDQIQQILRKFDSHPSIRSIRQKVNDEHFSFCNVTLENIRYEIQYAYLYGEGAGNKL